MATDPQAPAGQADGEDLVCSYCAGAVIRDEFGRPVHATRERRITNIGSGDLVSGLHNLAGTVVNSADLMTRRTFEQLGDDAQ